MKRQAEKNAIERFQSSPRTFAIRNEDRRHENKTQGEMDLLEEKKKRKNGRD
jgi:hypothetical protein